MPPALWTLSRFAWLWQQMFASAAAECSCVCAVPMMTAETMISTSVSDTCSSLSSSSIVVRMAAAALCCAGGEPLARHMHMAAIPESRPNCVAYTSRMLARFPGSWYRISFSRAMAASIAWYSPSLSTAESSVGMSLLFESELTLAISWDVSGRMAGMSCETCAPRRCFQSASIAVGRFALSTSKSVRASDPRAESLIATSATACATAPSERPKVSSPTRSPTSLCVTSSVMMQPSAQMSSFSDVQPVLQASGLEYAESVVCRLPGIAREVCRMS
mmetsp:Transcript_38309/g.78554  ORF Transcript_38309/g.78554 Transcript_38309/m.78554 type:complete len:275 (+) Transcript_38309:345-1169(+)